MGRKPRAATASVPNSWNYEIFEIMWISWIFQILRKIAIFFEFWRSIEKSRFLTNFLEKFGFSWTVRYSLSAKFNRFFIILGGQEETDQKTMLFKKDRKIRFFLVFWRTTWFAVVLKNRGFWWIFENGHIRLFCGERLGVWNLEFLKLWYTWIFKFFNLFLALVSFKSRLYANGSKTTCRDSIRSQLLKLWNIWNYVNFLDFSNIKENRDFLRILKIDWKITIFNKFSRKIWIFLNCPLPAKRKI